MSSFVRRLAFGLAFMDYNVVASGAIDSDSQMLWVRNVRDRVEKLAPFLSFDGDPYPVVDRRHVQWVVDGYTSTSRYPYAEAVGDDVVLSTDSGIPRDANYVRNSVKAVVDAYDGSVTHVRRRRRPIRSSRRGCRRSPTCSRPATRCPTSCATTCATPRTCSGCRPTCTPSTSSTRPTFFERDGAWSVAQAPSAAPRETATIDTQQPTAADRRTRAGAGDGDVERALRALLHDVRRGRAARLRAPAPVRAVLPRRPAPRAAGVHDGVERSGDLRRADRVRGAAERSRAARRPAGDRQLDAGRCPDQRGDHAPDSAAARGSGSATSSSSTSPAGCCGCARSTSASSRSRGPSPR